MYSPKEYALYLLKLRDRSEFEIRKKMKGKEFTPISIDETVDWLKEKQFIDDDRFVQNFVRLHLMVGKSGSRKMEFQLRHYGIDKEIIEKYLSEITKDDEFIRAEELAKSWLKKKTEIPPEKVYERLGRFLLSRGFSYDIIKPILDDARRIIKLHKALSLRKPE